MISDSGAVCVAISIDSLDINGIVLIQLDVEGHERQALAGAIDTIRRCRPAIAIEDNSQNCSDFLKQLNYSRVGSIPGLAIWAPSESLVMKSTILDFLAKLRTASVRFQREAGE